MPLHTRKWWGAPTRFDDRKYERKVSWLELFYDLVYVAAISQLTHHIAAHPSWGSITFSFLLFSLLFWSWINGSQYHDLHGSEGVRTRLITFWQMLAVAGVAITLNDAFEGNHKAFAIAFACLQVMVTWLWFSVGFYDPGHRRYSFYYTVLYLVALALLLISIFTSSSIATWIWIAVLALNVSPPIALLPTMLKIRKETGQEFSLSATVVERFGLFTIIVLAESILATVTGIAEVKDKLPAAWIAFILSILISFLLWSIYFDMTSEQEAKPGYINMQWYIILHFPLLASLGVVGACIKYMLLHMEGGLSEMLQWMFCAAVAMILLTTVALTTLMKEDEEVRSYVRPLRPLLIILSAIILVIPLVNLIHDVVLFLSVIGVILLIPIIYAVISWSSFKNTEQGTSNDEL
jgi:low temperature requirement protein LtrA